MNTKKVLLNALPLLLIGTAMVYAAAPSGGYLPGATNDPACAPGDADCFVLLPSETPNKFVDGTDPVDAVYTGTGNVGIGTTSPSEKLHVSDGWVTTDNTYGYRGVTASGATANMIRSDSADQMVVGSGFWKSLSLHAGAADRMYIDGNTGNVGIGTDSPISQLHIVEESRGVTQNHLEHDYYGIVVESEDAVLGLVSENEGGHGSGVDLLEVDNGVLQDKWSFIRLASDWGSNLHFNYGTSRLYTANPTLFTFSTDGHLGIGTTNPEKPLHILSGYDQPLIVESTDQFAGIHFKDSTTIVESSILGDGDNLKLQTNNTTKMTVLSDGNIGIGTTSPTQKLDVNGNAAAIKLLAGNGTAAGPSIAFRGDTGVNTGLYLPAQNEIGVSVNGVERVRIDADGKVGIGTVSPGSKLDVVNNGSVHMKLINTVKNGAIHFRTDTTGNAYINNMNNFANFTESGNELLTLTGQSGVRFSYGDIGTSGSEVMRIHTNGNVGIGTTTPSYKLHVNGSVAGVGAYVNTSDKRLKKDLVSIDNGLEKILELEGYTFDWRRDEYADMDFPEGRDMGVIAQDVEKVFPEAVSQDDEGMLSVGYSKLIAPIIEAIRELSEMMFGIDERVGELEMQNKILKAEIAEIRELLQK